MLECLNAFALDSKGQVFDLIAERNIFKVVSIPSLSNIRLIANYREDLLSVDRSDNVFITDCGK